MCKWIWFVCGWSMFPDWLQEFLKSLWTVLTFSNLCEGDGDLFFVRWEITENLVCFPFWLFVNPYQLRKYFCVHWKGKRTGEFLCFVFTFTRSWGWNSKAANFFCGFCDWEKSLAPSGWFQIFFYLQRVLINCKVLQKQSSVLIVLYKLVSYYIHIMFPEFLEVK